MIWLIGAGPMSVDYAKVLNAQDQKYIVIGRGRDSAEKFTEYTGKQVLIGGLEHFLSAQPEVADKAIVSVGVEQLFESTMRLIEYGVKTILVEKPGGMNSTEIDLLQSKAKTNSCSVYIAYNRRFFASVIEARKRIAAEGGASSFNFELTEWSHRIEQLDKPNTELNRWFLTNSSHVADLAFFLGGKPKEMSAFTSGCLSWHPASSVFAGAGVSEYGALFNYDANWESAGRWSVEVLTKKNRYVFRPMEKLQVQQRGTIPIVEVKIDDSIDKAFKPGLFQQVEAFLSGNDESLCSLEEQVTMFGIYEKMAGY